MPKRPFLLALAAALAVFLALGWSMIRASAPTFDEGAHLASGYGCLVHGPRCLNYEGHPPFPDKWAALPLLFLKPEGLFDSEEWINGRLYNYADRFLYKNRVAPETLLNTSRAWCLLTWSSALAIGILEWSLRLGGPSALWAGALLFAFCPVLISNAALVTTDAASTAFFFLTMWLLSFKPRRNIHWALAGATAGLGVASKYNMPVIFVIAGVCLALEGSRPKPSALARSALAGAFVFAASYQFADFRQYLIGLKTTVSWMREGWASYLFGDISTTGHRLYFPAALAIKTPIPLLIASAAGFVLLVGAPVFPVWLLVPPLAYFAATGFSKMQIGVRHVMPVMPFMIVCAAQAAAWAWKRSRVLVGVLAAWLVAGVLAVHPHYLAYFNETVGGPSQGHRFLLDSNLDWGQGLKELALELRRRGNPPIVFSYFGNGDPAYYGLRYVPLAFAGRTERLSVARTASGFDPVLLAVSATNLHGVYFENHKVFDWLESRRPVFAAGHSIFLYDLTGDREGRSRLADILAQNGYPDLGARLMRHAAKL